MPPGRARHSGFEPVSGYHSSSSHLGHYDTAPPDSAGSCDFVVVSKRSLQKHCPGFRGSPGTGKHSMRPSYCCSAEHTEKQGLLGLQETFAAGHAKPVHQSDGFPGPFVCSHVRKACVHRVEASSLMLLCPLPATAPPGRRHFERGTVSRECPSCRRKTKSQ